MDAFYLFSFFLFIFSFISYTISVYYYKSFLNPLGLYSIIWGTIPFLYQLKLFSILRDLSIETFVALFLSYFSFYIGCIIVSSKRMYYVKKVEVPLFLRQRSKRLYFCLLFLCLIEMLIKTPPLFSTNPFQAYMSGVGVRFFHYAVVLITVPTLVRCVDSTIIWRKKVLWILPCIVIPLIYMQRGLSISAILAIIFVLLYVVRLRKQFIILTIAVLGVVSLVTLVGSYRQSFNSSASTIGDVTGVSSDIPESVVWLYAYTTPSVQNLNQAVNNENVDFKYGFGLIEPILSVLQIKSLFKFCSVTFLSPPVSPFPQPNRT